MVSFLLSSGMPSTNPVCTFLTLYTLRSVPFRFVHFHCLGKNNHDNKRAYASTMDCFTHIRALLVLHDSGIRIPWKMHHRCRSPDIEGLGSKAGPQEIAASSGRCHTKFRKHHQALLCSLLPCPSRSQSAKQAQTIQEGICVGSVGGGGGEALHQTALMI